MNAVVLDSSVYVAAIMPQETHHALARECVSRLASERAIVVPTLFDVEVTASLVRRGKDAREAAYERFRKSIRERVSLTRDRAEAARRVAAMYRLRGADSVYVEVAQSKNLSLLTLDAEILERVPHVGIAPSMWLAMTDSPTER